MTICDICDRRTGGMCRTGGNSITVVLNQHFCTPTTAILNKSYHDHSRFPTSLLFINALLAACVRLSYLINSLAEGSIRRVSETPTQQGCCIPDAPHSRLLVLGGSLRGRCDHFANAHSDMLQSRSVSDSSLLLNGGQYSRPVVCGESSRDVIVTYHDTPRILIASR